MSTVPPEHGVLYTDPARHLEQIAWPDKVVDHSGFVEWARLRGLSLGQWAASGLALRLIRPGSKNVERSLLDDANFARGGLLQSKVCVLAAPERRVRKEQRWVFLCDAFPQPRIYTAPVELGTLWARRVLQEADAVLRLGG